MKSSIGKSEYEAILALVAALPADILSWKPDREALSRRHRHWRATYLSQAVAAHCRITPQACINQDQKKDKTMINLNDSNLFTPVTHPESG
ncbi:MAG: hypothetical protein JW934_06305, partial [Anaerolineae bacterium]|nr:hypothetical protein [Anaerolineae bacterium]